MLSDTPPCASTTGRIPGEFGPENPEQLFPLARMQPRQAQFDRPAAGQRLHVDPDGHVGDRDESDARAVGEGEVRAAGAAEENRPAVRAAAVRAPVTAEAKVPGVDAEPVTQQQSQPHMRR